MIPVRRALIGFLAVVVVGCGAEPVPPADPIALPSPVREARTVPQPDGSIRIEAVSARAAPNQPYAFAVFTHCGFTANTFDFDGSFWAAIEVPAGFANNNGNPPAGIDNPTDAGVIQLVAADRAIWTSRGGLVLGLARGPSEVQIFGCD